MNDYPESHVPDIVVHSNEFVTVHFLELQSASLRG